MSKRTYLQLRRTLWRSDLKRRLFSGTLKNTKRSEQQINRCDQTEEEKSDSADSIKLWWTFNKQIKIIIIGLNVFISLFDDVNGQYFDLVV